MKVNISALTKREAQSVIEEANFSEEQLNIFNALNKDRFYDYAIMSDLSLDSRRYYKVKKIVLEKVERIAQLLGYKNAIKVT